MNGSEANGAMPHDEAAEDALLGAALVPVSGVAAVETVERIGPDVFYRPRNKRIAEAIGKLRADGLNVDATLVNSARSGAPEDLAELLSLMVATPSTSNAESYARRILDTSRQRQIIGITYEIADAARNGMPLGPKVAELDTLHRATTGEVIFEDVAAGLDQDSAHEASLLVRSDGQRLLYRGAVNAFAGEPSAGKTTIAGQAVVQVVEAEGHVMFLDFEDVLPRVLARLLALGAAPQALVDRFHYQRPGHLTDDHANQLAHAAHRMDLVVIDGVAESLAAQGLNEDAAGDTAAWWALLPRRLADAGPAVLLLDHVTKSKDGRGRYARGSGHKLAAIDGAHYSAEALEPFSREHAGCTLLVLQKDRPGSVGANGTTAAVVRFTPHNSGQRLTVTIDPPAITGTLTTSTGQQPINPDHHAAVLELLAGHTEPLSWRKIARALRAQGHKFGDEPFRVTLTRMHQDGDLDHTKGTSNADLYSLPARQTTLDEATP